VTGPRGGEPRRSPLARLALLVLVGLAVAGLTALGVWQLERRVWKLDLIARVNARVHAAPIAPPGPADWPAISTAKDEYVRVRLIGRFLNDRETLVQALTDLGPGFWVLTPLKTDRGFLVLVNRGFVPPERRAAVLHSGVSGETSVTGLLRISEPKGRFLRPNDPAAERWYSRDVAAIAAARGLADVAPYFVDAEAGADPKAWPRGGLTVISFPNNHLVYALTWFSLALLLAGVTLYNVWEEWHGRHEAAKTGS
jgi:surfeit locus 1 family protein